MNVFLSMIDLSDLSRVNKELMPKQALMELLVKNLKDKQAFQDGEEFLKDISTWDGLEFSENEEVTDIDWTYYYYILNSIVYPGGSIDIQWIPSTVIRFNIWNLELFGTVETHDLPRGLKAFHIANNCFSGTFCIENLPNTIQSVNISRNQLSGSLRLDKLPSSLTFSDAGYNNFSGSLNLTSLPACLTNLTLNNNAFSGTIDLQVLPSTIQVLRLEENSLKQTEVEVSDLRKQAFLSLDKESFVTLVGSDGKPIENLCAVNGVIEVII